MAHFEIESFQNEFLPRCAQIMHAVISVTVSETGSTVADDQAELLIVDTSGSMNGMKLRSVKEATAAAIDCIPNGARFGIIAGNHEAQVAFPSVPPLALSSPRTRNEAKAAVKKFEARGRTAIESWIELARQMFSDCTGIRHAILLTDGKNENGDPEALQRALDQAEGVFQCDCRGVGDGWDVAELRNVAKALLGDLDLVAQPDELVADFTRLIRQSFSKQLAEVSLRVWTPKGGEVVALKQLDPEVDLTPSRIESSERTGDYATGAWGDESRDFHLTVGVPTGDVGDRMLVARATLVVGDEPVGEGQVLAEWTDDVGKSTRVNRKVAQAIRHAEFADAIDKAMHERRARNDGEEPPNTSPGGVRVPRSPVPGSPPTSGYLELPANDSGAADR